MRRRNHSVFKRITALGTAGAILLALSPLAQLQASGIAVGPAAVPKALPGQIGAVGSAVQAAGLTGPRGGVLERLDLSLTGSVFGTPSVPTVTHNIAAPGTALPVQAAVFEDQGISPGEKVSVSPSAGPQVRSNEGSPLRALHETGKGLSRKSGNVSVLLDNLFSGKKGGSDAEMVPASSGFGYSGSRLLSAPQGKSDVPDLLVVDVRQGMGPPGDPSMRNGSTSRMLLRWGAGAIVTVIGVLAAPSFGHAAGKILVPGLTGIGFDSVMEALSHIGYVGANVIGFIYMLPQVYKIIRNRSGKIAAGTVVTGTIASGILAFNAAFAQKGLWTFQNLMGSMSFGASLVLMWLYSRRVPETESGPSDPKAVKRRRMVDSGKAAAAFALLAGAAVLGSKFLVALVPALPFAAGMIVPLQMIAALGFAFLFMPQYIKMEMEKSAGDASVWTTVGFIAATSGISLWALWQAAMIPTGAALSNLLVVGAYLAAVMVPSHFVLRGMARIPWQRLPAKMSLGRLQLARETLISVLSLAILGVYMAAVLGLGVISLNGILSFTSGGVNQFWMYLLYVVENVFAALVSLYTLQAAKKYRHSSG